MQPSAAPPPPVSRRRSPAKFAVLALLLLAAAFAAGYVPQMQRAGRAEKTLSATAVDLELARTHRLLGVAALEAQRHNFANAGTAAASFFDRCATLARDPAFADEPRTRVALEAYAAQRDQIMVQLANADATVVPRLSSLYLTMDGVIARRP